MMPLCTIAIPPVQSACGCAFVSVIPPCVAQRVWTMAVLENDPGAASTAISPTRLMQAPELSAYPNESYPLYSRRFSAVSISFAENGCLKANPTIPHILYHFPHLLYFLL